MYFYLKLYLLTLPAFLFLDMIWVGFIAHQFFRRQVGHLMAVETNWPAAILFYLMFPIGILFFAVLPALEVNDFQKVVINGLMLGFITYATYELTNHALLKNWTWATVVVDLLWGIFIVTLVSVYSFKVGLWLKV